MNSIGQSEAKMLGAKEKPNLVLLQQEQLSKQSKIVILLSVLGIRLQTKLTTEEYRVFATDLEPFDLLDIEAGLYALGTRPRGEYETAFPGTVKLIEAVKQRRLLGGRMRAAFGHHVVSAWTAKIQPLMFCRSEWFAFAMPRETPACESRDHSVTRSGEEADVSDERDQRPKPPPDLLGGGGQNLYSLSVSRPLAREIFASTK
jgi:hypothetical protein